MRFCGAIPGPQPTQWTDSNYDMGVFAASKWQKLSCSLSILACGGLRSLDHANSNALKLGAFSLGTEKTKGKTYPCVAPMITMDEMAATFTRVTGQPAVHDPLTPDEWADMGAVMMGPAYRDDIRDMMRWVSEAPKNKILYGSLDPEADKSAEELGVRASTFEEWLKRTGWAGPTDMN